MHRYLDWLIEPSEKELEQRKRDVFMNIDRCYYDVINWNKTAIRLLEEAEISHNRKTRKLKAAAEKAERLRELYKSRTKSDYWVLDEIKEVRDNARSVGERFDEQFASMLKRQREEKLASEKSQKLECGIRSRRK